MGYGNTRSHRVSRSILIAAIVLTAGLGGSAAAENLQTFFGIQNKPTPIGKLKADNATLTCTKSVSREPVVCNDGSYAAQCASGNCGCINYTCTNAGGTTSTGTGTLEIGFDFGNGPTLGGAPDCYPIFGVYNGTGKKDPHDEETDFDGVACDPLTGSDAAITGGWQLIDAQLSSIVDGAGGTLSGTLNLGTSALKLVFKGDTF